MVIIRQLLYILIPAGLMIRSLSCKLVNRKNGQIIIKRYVKHLTLDLSFIKKLINKLQKMGSQTKFIVV